MYTKLSIPERLKDLRVVDKHLTLEQLAEQTGLSKSALGKYEGDDYKDISPFAIATLAEFYGVSTDYLMGLSENKTIPNSDLQSLHLSDEMIELLRSGRINNRLLCELATHEGFPRLMTDITVIVDRIAGMRVSQMNLELEAARQSVMESYAPGDDDLYMRTLEVAQIDGEDYFNHIVHALLTCSLTLTFPFLLLLFLVHLCQHLYQSRFQNLCRDFSSFDAQRDGFLVDFFLHGCSPPIYCCYIRGGLPRLQAVRYRPAPSGTSCDTGAADSRTPICGGSACRDGRCPFPDAGASCVQTDYR